jgi:hypothetical protein
VSRAQRRDRLGGVEQRAVEPERLHARAGEPLRELGGVRLHHRGFVVRDEAARLHRGDADVQVRVHLDLDVTVGDLAAEQLTAVGRVAVAYLVEQLGHRLALLHRS